jgi:hypothetical protein
MAEFKTLSTVAQELGWTVATLRYRLGKREDINPAHIRMGKHSVRILDSKDVAKLAERIDQSKGE